MGCGQSSSPGAEMDFSNNAVKTPSFSDHKPASSQSQDSEEDHRYSGSSHEDYSHSGHNHSARHKNTYHPSGDEADSDSKIENGQSGGSNGNMNGHSRRFSNSTDESTSDQEKADAIRNSQKVEVVDNKKSKRGSHSDDFTSDEDMSPYSPPGRERQDEKEKKANHVHDNGVDNELITPVVMGHHRGAKQEEKTPATVTAKMKASHAPPASVETQLKAVVRMQKLFRARKHWNRIVEEREWKIFNDLDTQDEADMLNLACFMQTLLDWNASTDVEKSETETALDHDSEAEDYPNGQPNLKKDVSVRTAQLNAVSVHSSVNIHGNSNDFNLPKGPLSSKVAEEIIAVYKNKGHLSLKSIQKILRFSYKSFKKLTTVSHIRIEKGEKVTVVGDLHGQLGDLFHILQESGWPSPTNKYVFNGDFVDRGEQGVEVVCVLLSLFAAMPDCVYMNRGNHEDHAICCVYGFEKEVKDKYDELTFGMFVEIFRHIPLFAILNEEVFVVHGGLFHDVNVKLSDLAEIERTEYAAKPPIPYPECCDGLGPADSRKEYLKQLQRDALWSDPNEFEVLSKNSRGSGVVFGPEVTRRFLKNNKLLMIVRSHECVRQGFDQPFSGAFENLLCTVFSASNYCGGHNDAAYMTFACHSMTNGRPISHSKTHLHYNVHHFNLSDAKQSLKAANHDSIREMILRKAKALQQAFEVCDTSCSKKVTKSQWSEIMQRVTNLKIMWLAIVKDLSPECISGNFINYSTFLKSLKKAVEKGNSITVDSLYGQRQKLETIFHFFDKNGDGTISREEFRKGCDFMNTTLPPDQQLRDYDHILDLMDFDQSDSIDLNEFFEVFRILDAKDGVVDGVISLAAKQQHA